MWARDNQFGLDKRHRGERVVGTHGEVVADAQNGDVHRFGGEQFHIVRQGGVTGNIDLVAGQVDQKTSRITAVGAIRQPRPVVGNGHLDPAKREIPAPADMHGVHVFHTLFTQPAGDFKIGDHRGTRAPGNGHRVAHVIEVPVGEQDIIGLQIIGTGRRGRVVGEERIDQQGDTVTR